MSLASVSVEQLARLLADSDPHARVRALGELVRRGAAAVPALLQALAHTDRTVRTLAAEGLGEIADPAQAGLYRRMLDDDDGNVRARGAQGLALIDEPGGLDALVRTIDDLPDLEHAPETLSTHLLIARGAAALPVVAPLLSAPQPVTRERAFLVVLRVLEELRGAATVADTVGDLGDPRLPAVVGEGAAARWRAWIAREFP